MAQPGPSKQLVIETINCIVQETLEVHPDEESRLERFSLDRFDSLDLLDLLASLEKAFDIDLSPEECLEVKCLYDLYGLVYRKRMLARHLLPDSLRAKLAFVVPVFNHAASLEKLLRTLVQFQVRVIVVDDGSTDNSHQCARQFPTVEVLRHPKNLGKGAALLTGFGQAAQTARWAISLDADGQHDPLDVLDMLDQLPAQGPTLVLGRRLGMEGKNVPWTSRFGRSFSNFWVWAASGVRVSDSQSGFRIYPLPETLVLRTKARRFQYEVEVVVAAFWCGMPILEVPVGVQYQPKAERVSHFRPFLDFWRNAGTFTRLIVLRLFVPRRCRGRFSKPESEKTA